MYFFHSLFVSRLFQSDEVLNALYVGTVVAAVSGCIGVFVVIRGQSFVGHVLTDIGAAGASGAVLLGFNAWYGFLSFGLLAGTGVELLSNRARNRDVATGIILSFAMGLGALFLFFVTQHTSNASTAMVLLFGSIFVVDPHLVPIVIYIGVASVFLLCILYRPLLLCSINPDIARSRGLPVRFIGIAFMILLAAAVEDGSLVIGALLSTVLLIGPAATAVRLTSRTGLALIWAALIGMVATWLGIILAYSSYYWPPYGHGWPVSFFIALLILIFYLLSRSLPYQIRMIRHRLRREA